MQRFSACLVTFDEEDNLGDALASVSFADEIIVVDSHSTDRTREIAAEFRGRSRDGESVTPRVIERDWPGHLEQKNFAIDQATHDWVLCLDADERLSEAAQCEVQNVLGGELPDCSGYSFPRKTFYLNRWILHGGWYPDRKLRLFRRSQARWGGVNPHDHVQTESPTWELQGDILHYSYDSLSAHVRQIDFFTDIAAREKQKSGVGHPVLRMVGHAPFKFFKMYVLQQGFRDGIAGFISATLGAYYVFLKYAKLWEQQLRETPKPGER